MQQEQGAAVFGAALSPAISPPSGGVWRDSGGVYSLGSLAATLVEALVLIIMVSPTSGGWGGGLLLALMLLGTVAALVIVPLASWFAWFCTPPELAAAPRWLMLTMIASLVSLAVVFVVALSLRVIDVWVWLAAPIAGLHAWWSALFLIGRRRAAVAPAR